MNVYRYATISKDMQETSSSVQKNKHCHQEIKLSAILISLKGFMNDSESATS